VESREELIRRAYAAWSREDFDEFTTALHPSVAWYSSGAFPGFEPVYRGVEGVRRWWYDFKEPFETSSVELEDLTEHGDAVLTTVRLRGVGKGSGVAVDLPFYNTFRFQDGVVSRFASFASLEEALADVNG
jgi:ketosteroid isomerase-like protein